MASGIALDDGKVVKEFEKVEKSGSLKNLACQIQIPLIRL